MTRFLKQRSKPLCEKIRVARLSYGFELSHPCFLLSPYSNDAIRRCRQDDADEKSKLYFSYESFVENLDEGDTFTVHLIEILVKVRNVCVMQSRTTLLTER